MPRRRRLDARSVVAVLRKLSFLEIQTSCQETSALWIDGCPGDLKKREEGADCLVVLRRSIPAT
jgi:hypothetical protein